MKIKWLCEAIKFQINTPNYMANELKSDIKKTLKYKLCSFQNGFWLNNPSINTLSCNLWKISEQQIFADLLKFKMADFQQICWHEFSSWLVLALEEFTDIRFVDSPVSLWAGGKQSSIVFHYFILKYKNNINQIFIVKVKQ